MQTSHAVDVLVVGGGATGAAAAYDLARRGLRPLLVEQLDLSTGTSGRYHGLLHSGGRYAGRDLETAAECIAENQVLRRIAPFAIEDTGGLFVATPDDPADFPDRWLAGCRAAGIPTESMSAAQARAQEPALTTRITAAYRVPDGSCDSFDLIHAFVEATRAGGDAPPTACASRSARRRGRGAHWKTRDRRTRTVSATACSTRHPWRARVAGWLATGSRPRRDDAEHPLVNTVVNRCAPPTMAILVPVGTVCVLGTTSVHTDHPDDYRIEAWEVSKIRTRPMSRCPHPSRARAAGVGGRATALRAARSGHDEAAGRGRRTFSVIDHAQRDGVRGLRQGRRQLTTCRLMAEQAVDGLRADGHRGALHHRRRAAAGRTPRAITRSAGAAQIEHGGCRELICECEMVTRAQLEAAIAAYGDQPVALDDLRRDLRLGMGPCQAGFCSYRAAGILQAEKGHAGPDAAAAFGAFVDERFRGVRPLLWGHQLRQVLLDELIYRRTLGLDQLVEESAKEPANG